MGHVYMKGYSLWPVICTPGTLVEANISRKKLISAPSLTGVEQTGLKVHTMGNYGPLQVAPEGLSVPSPHMPFYLCVGALHLTDTGG